MIYKLLKPAKPALIAFTMTCALMSSACLSILPKAQEAPSIYRLTQSPISLSSVPGAPSVRIAIPAAPKALQGTDLVVSPDGDRLAYASGARWAQPIPKLLQDAALQALGQYSSVTAIAPPTVARADYAVELNIRAFEAAFDRGQATAPLGKVRIVATLTELQTRRVVAKKEFYAEERAAEVRVSSIVKAQDRATNTVMNALSEWIVAQTAPRPAGS